MDIKLTLYQFKKQDWLELIDLSIKYSNTDLKELLYILSSLIKYDEHNPFQKLCYLDLFKILIENDSNLINTIDPIFGNSILHVAVIQNRAKICLFLADFNLSQIINLKNKQVNTPLHEAIKKGNIEIIQTLMQDGTNLNTQNKIGDTPLHEAIKNENIGIIQILLQHGSDPNIPNIKGDTSLHEAIKKGNIVIVQILMQRGSDPDILNQMGNTPLHEANVCYNIKEVRNNYKEIIRILINSGANPYIWNEKNQPPDSNMEDEDFDIFDSKILEENDKQIYQ